MSHAESQPPPGPEVVVAEDGSLPAETLARYGFRPGSHLYLVSGASDQPQRKTSRGVLKGLIDAEAITEALRENKEERIAAILRDDQQ